MLSNQSLIDWTSAMIWSVWLSNSLSMIILAIISSANAAFNLLIASASPVAAFSISSRCSVTKSVEIKSLLISSTSESASLMLFEASANSLLSFVLFFITSAQSL